MTRKPRGFTLVELLVVVGIIAVLIAVLLPALGRARANAASVQCLSNLRQVGQATFMYANLNKGFLPTQIPGSPYRLSQWQAEQISRVLKGNTNVFYCPVNQLLAPAGQDQIVPDDFYPPDHGGAWIGSPIKSGRILYWWVADPDLPDYTGTTLDANGFPPNPPPAGQSYEFRWRDTNANGSVRDEYIRHLGEKNMANIVICTDWSGQLGGTNRGWFFIHGTQQRIENTGNAATDMTVRKYKSWKNNLYGDGHAEPKRPDEVKWRWSPAGPTCW
jgi:prepilin-type N-terminal cleavage/methylation domain-containing protein